MTFSEGTKEQLDQQWADVEADKQEALARIRAKQDGNVFYDRAIRYNNERSQK